MVYYIQKGNTSSYKKKGRKTMTVFEKATKQYNEIMYDIGLEFLTIGTRFSENTDGWTLRDMVSEMQYQLDVCYEDGNANAEARDIEFLMDAYGMDEETARADHAAWLKKTRRLRAFINKYKTEALKVGHVTSHCSKFD